MRIHIRDHGELELPAPLLNNIRTVHGAGFDRWLAGLGSLVHDVLEEQDARLAPGIPGLSYHLVFFAQRSNGEEVAIKCTVPNEEQPPELAGVGALSDAGIGPRLCWSDLDRGVMIMERVRPGETLSTAMPSLDEDARITRTIASLSARMARDVSIGDHGDELVPVRRYTRALEDIDSSSSLWGKLRDEVQRALDVRNTLLAASDRRDVFLHGDLHHYNLLRDHDKGLSVIDPKGLRGPAGYDFGALTYNPVGIQRHPQLAPLTRQRVDIWSEVTGLPWEEVRSWGYVATMLSACWSAENGGDNWHGALSIARILRELMPIR